jgi:hypothetical protein
MESYIQIQSFETLKNSFEIDFETYEVYKKNKIRVFELPKRMDFRPYRNCNSKPIRRTLYKWVD